MRVNELANKLSVTPDTVRYYTRIGILSPRKSLANGYKNYTRDDEARLRFVIKAKNLGFSVQEIQEILEMSQQGKSPCCQVRSLVQQHIDQVNKKIAELSALKMNMEQAFNSWQTIEDRDPEQQNICDLIEMWDELDLQQESQ